jgi:hypothetical protein
MQVLLEEGSRVETYVGKGINVLSLSYGMKMDFFPRIDSHEKWPGSAETCALFRKF